MNISHSSHVTESVKKKEKWNNKELKIAYMNPINQHDTGLSYMKREKRQIFIGWLIM